MSRQPLVSNRFGPFLQLGGMIRKELTEIVRQPRVLFVLVLGPFLVLGLFAAGFDRRETVLTTLFIGPEGGIYEEPLQEFGDELDDYIEVYGYDTDLVEARDLLIDQTIDLIVVLPSDPADTVLNGEQATIEVIHDKLDPIQQTAVDVSTQVAVQELNSRILEAAVGSAQEFATDYESTIDDSATILDQLAQAAADGDDEGVAASLAELETTTGALASATSTSSDIARALGADDEQQSQFDELATSSNNLQSNLEPLVDTPDEFTQEDADRLGELLEMVRSQSDQVVTIPPAVVVRPFFADTEALERRSVTVIDFFATGAIALLLQHMVFTFAAMSLVNDRSIGLFELYRVGPIGSGRVLLSKYVAYTLIGGLISAVLLAGVHFGLDVPLRGDVTMLAVGVGLMLIASIGFGSVVSLLSSSATQAVQFALLALLASLFFTGLFLDLGAFVYPVKAITWALPATYGSRLLRDVMLRGNDPQTIDLIGLGVSSAVFAAIAWLLLWRRLRSA